MVDQRQRLIDARKARIPLARAMAHSERSRPAARRLVVLAGLMAPLVIASIGGVFYMQSVSSPAARAATSPVALVPGALPTPDRRIEADHKPGEAVVVTVAGGKARTGDVDRIAVGAIPAVPEGVPEVAHIVQRPGPLPAPSSEAVDCVERAAELAARSTVWFTPKSQRVPPAAHEAILRLADALATCPTARVEVGGHADDAADGKMNVQLSLERARSVTELLASRGVAAGQIEPIAYGASRRLSKSKRPDDAQLNRRVDLVVR